MIFSRARGLHAYAALRRSLNFNPIPSHRVNKYLSASGRPTGASTTKTGRPAYLPIATPRHHLGLREERSPIPPRRLLVEARRICGKYLAKARLHVEAILNRAYERTATAYVRIPRTKVNMLPGKSGAASPRSRWKILTPLRSRSFLGAGALVQSHARTHFDRVRLPRRCV